MMLSRAPYLSSWGQTHKKPVDILKKHENNKRKGSQLNEQAKSQEEGFRSFSKGCRIAAEIAAVSNHLQL